MLFIGLFVCLFATVIVQKSPSLNPCKLFYLTQLFFLLIASASEAGPGPRPDLTGGVYSAPSDPLSAGRGLTSPSQNPKPPLSAFASGFAPLAKTTPTLLFNKSSTALNSRVEDAVGP